MNFADLTDTDLTFHCDVSHNDYYWDYEFSIYSPGEKYYRDLTKDELKQLRKNCKRILQETELFQGGN